MVGIWRFLIAAVIASVSQAALAQHGDFAPKVKLIVDYLKDTGETCISPPIAGERPFKACREGAEPAALTVATDIPVRDDDGRVIDACPARLTATQVPGFAAVKMEVSARECPQKTLQSGEFSRIFVGIIVALAAWIENKAKPL